MLGWCGAPVTHDDEPAASLFFKDAELKDDRQYLKMLDNSDTLKISRGCAVIMLCWQTLRPNVKARVSSHEVLQRAP